MQDLLHLIKGIGHSLMSMAEPEVKDMRTPSTQSLAHQETADDSNTAGCGDFGAPATADFLPTSGDEGIVAVAQDPATPLPASPLLLDPPTTKERFQRIETALNAANLIHYSSDASSSQSVELGSSFMLPERTSQGGQEHPDDPKLKKPLESQHRIRRRPCSSDLGAHEIVRGRNNGKRSISSNALLKLRRSLDMLIGQKREALNGQNATSVANTGLRSTPGSRPKLEPRAATSNDSREMSHDLVDFLGQGNLSAGRAPKQEQETQREVKSDSLPSKSQILSRRAMSEDAVVQIGATHKPNIVYLVDLPDPDKEEDIFRSPAALHRMLDEAKRTVERQMWEAFRVVPRCVGSPGFPAQPSRQLHRRRSSKISMVGIGNNGVVTTTHKVAQPK